MAKISTGKVAIILLSVIVIVAVGISVIWPNGAIGYRKVFIDSRTHTYDQDTPFQYDQYEMRVKYTEVVNKASLHDCAQLLEGGVFNPSADAFYQKQANPNYWPKEDCEAENKKLTMDANKQKTIKVEYSIKNLSSEVGNISKGWMKVYSTQGKEIVSSDNDLIVAPQTVISGELKLIVKSEVEVQNASVVLPGHAPQVVRIK